MRSLTEISKLLKDWHYGSLNTTEKKFIDEIILYGSDLNEELSTKQKAWIRRIGKRFLII